jgi:hypothetical protein
VIPVEGREPNTGILWLPGDASILLLHDRGADASLDSWGAWPERLAALGYAVLAVDLPDDASTEDIRAVATYLRTLVNGKLFIIAAGERAEMLDSVMADGLVMIAPRGDALDPTALGFVPKLIVAGSADDREYPTVERFARACRGWSLLSTYATENTPEALLEGRHALQVGSQFAGFLQEFRTTFQGQTSMTTRRPPR